MNLDEMKNSWNVLNERLEQNEILNKRIIEEMVASKTKSAYDCIFPVSLISCIHFIFLHLYPQGAKEHPSLVP